MAQQDQIKRVIELGVAQVNINSRDVGLALAALAQENARQRLISQGTISVAAAAADAGNTGNGTVTLGNPAFGAGVTAGTYTLTCTAAAVDGGTFSVTDPEGNVIGSVDVGTAYVGEISFTVNDGATDFIVGDIFTIAVTAMSEAALVDSSGATAGTDLEAITTPTTAAVDNVVSMAPKAGFDTAIGKIEDAHEEIGAALSTMIAIIAGNTYPTPATLSLAASADLTIAALDLTLTGTTADDAGVEASSGITQINTARNNQASLASALNFVRVAVGLAPITDGSGGVFTRTQSEWPMDDAAATGTAAANGANSLTDATVDAALTALGNNIATLAAKLAECQTSLRIGPFVVATHNPRTRFVAGDVTV